MTHALQLRGDGRSGRSLMLAEAIGSIPIVTDPNVAKGKIAIVGRTKGRDGKPKLNVVTLVGVG